jgi:hypothetical protein
MHPLDQHESIIIEQVSVYENDFFVLFRENETMGKPTYTYGLCTSEDQAIQLLKNKLWPET